MKWLIAILILAIVLIAGCTQISSVVCKPNWVLGVGGGDNEICKSQCYANDKVTSYKIENNKCYCDINNCNPNTEQSNQEKPKIDCKNNESLCNETLSNCTDSILIEEAEFGIIRASLNISKKNQNCNVLFYVEKADTPKFENTSMICNFPIVNGETVVKNDYCEGSYIDALNKTSGFLSPTARGFGQVQVLNPWSLSATNGSMILYLENRVGGTITVTSISYTLTLTNGRTGTYSATPTCSNGCISGTNVAPDGKAVFTATPTVWSGATSRNDYTATVIITYIYGGQTFTSTGTLSGTYS